MMISLPEILTDDFYSFVKTHASENADRLRLYCHGKDFSFPSDIAVDQIEARRKVRKKLPEIFGYQRFFFPSVVLAEQCTSESLARLHADILRETGTVLDMTGGLGIDAFAFARYAKEVTAIELNELAAQAGNHNAGILGIGNVRFVQGDSIGYLHNTSHRFDLIFADPARRVDGNRVYSFRDCLPDIPANIQLLRSHSDRLILKGSPMLDITDTLRLFPGTEEVWIFSSRNDCKEVVVNVNLAVEKAARTKIIALNTTPRGEQRFDFWLNESIMEPRFFNSIAELQALNTNSTLYLYEPNASLMKCSPWSELSRCFPELIKLSTNTHLFVSGKLYDSFPGKVTKILSIASTKPEIAQLKKIKANVVTRNYPATAESLRKQLKISDGGNRYVYGCRCGSSTVLILSQFVG